MNTTHLLLIATLGTIMGTVTGYILISAFQCYLSRRREQKWLSEYKKENNHKICSK